LTEKSKKAKPLNKKILLLSTASEAIDENLNVEDIKEEVPAPAPSITTKKPRAKKLNFVIETEEPYAPVQPTEVTIIKESETPGPSTKAKKVTSKKVTLKLEE
jgi:hypothetical protein